MQLVILDKESAKKTILEEITDVHLAIDKERAAPVACSLRMDELKIRLAQLYRRYTDIANAR